MDSLPLTCVVFSDVRVWDVVSELVGLCTMPPPDNPFSLDTRYLQSVPLPDRFLITGALLNFLEGLVVQGNQEEVYYDMGASGLLSLKLTKPVLWKDSRPFGTGHLAIP